MTRKRKPISEKVRFEVFKRDQFQCQYCGNKAPECVLHVDHIKPVSMGGANHIINLVTSCQSCNQGKSDKVLSDDSFIKAQRNQIEQISVKHEQALMMIQWHEEMQQSENLIVSEVESYLNKKIKPFAVTLEYKKDLGTWIKKYGFAKVIDSINIAEEHYLKYGLDEKSAHMMLSKIPGILYLQKKGPLFQEISRIKAAGKKKFGYWDEKTASKILKNILDILQKDGLSQGEILDELIRLKNFTKECRNWSLWRLNFEEYVK